MMDSVLQGFLYALGGSAITQMVGYVSSRKTAKENDATEIRKELWDELKLIRAETQRQAEEIDDWKRKFYDLLKKNQEITENYYKLLRAFETIQQSFLACRMDCPVTEIQEKAKREAEEVLRRVETMNLPKVNE